MAILSNGSIAAFSDQGLLRPFYRGGLQPASYDARLHWKLLVSPTRQQVGQVVDLRQEPKRKFSVEPGRFVGVLTTESFDMPLNLAGRFGLRSEFTRKGLVAFGGIQIDPGFKGRLAISLINIGPEPLDLKYRQKMFTIEFHTLEKLPTMGYEGEFQDQDDFPRIQRRFIMNAKTASFAEINSLPSEIALVRQQLAVHEHTAHALTPTRTLQDLAEAQGIRALGDPNEIVGGWPKEEDFDSFLEAIGTIRELSS